MRPELSIPPDELARQKMRTNISAGSSGTDLRDKQQDKSDVPAAQDTKRSSEQRRP